MTEEFRTRLWEDVSIWTRRFALGYPPTEDDRALLAATALVVAWDPDLLPQKSELAAKALGDFDLMSNVVRGLGELRLALGG